VVRLNASIVPFDSHYSPACSRIRVRRAVRYLNRGCGRSFGRDPASSRNNAATICSGVRTGKAIVQTAANVAMRRLSGLTALLNAGTYGEPHWVTDDAKSAAFLDWPADRT